MAESTVLKISSVCLTGDYWGGSALPNTISSSTEQHWGHCAPRWASRGASGAVMWVSSLSCLFPHTLAGVTCSSQLCSGHQSVLEKLSLSYTRWQHVWHKVCTVHLLCPLVGSSRDCSPVAEHGDRLMCDVRGGSALPSVILQVRCQASVLAANRYHWSGGTSSVQKQYCPTEDLRNHKLFVCALLPPKIMKIN